MSAAAKATQTVSVKKELVVEAPQERAFRVFSENMGSWWPASHHIGKTPMKDTVVEPKANGRWYELCEDGSTCDWGKVLVWEPPKRLVLTWQLTAEWQYDPNFITEVEVTFASEGPKKTRVTLEHRHLERYGEKMVAEIQKTLGGDGGWTTILAAFGAGIQK